MIDFSTTTFVPFTTVVCEIVASAKSAELASWYFEQLEANGMAVEDASPEFLAELQAIGAKMTADWLASAGADGQAILDAYKSN
mgnify:CR=1 FL=1